MRDSSFVDKLLKPWSPVVEWLSLEKLLTATKRANGGDIILLRTLGITTWLYLLAVVLKQGLDADRTWQVSRRALLTELRDTLPWAGAIFAAVYASLYTRFASQWLYLAGLYNQIKAVEARTSGVRDARPAIAAWKAGFLEDAQVLHLATKGLFVSVIKMWGDDEAVKEQFIKNTPGGEDRFTALMKDVNEVYLSHGQLSTKGTRASMPHASAAVRPASSLAGPQVAHVSRGTSEQAKEVKTQDRFVLGVDLDGVVADFYGGLRPIAAEWLGVTVDSLTLEVTYGLPEWNIGSSEIYEDLHRFAVTQRDLFQQLIPIDGAPAVLRRLSQQDIRIRIITHRLYIKYFHEEAVSQTTRWLEHHGIPYWDLCFMKDKAAVGADLYIEDSPSNVNRLRTDGHETIVFSNSTNRALPEPRAESWDDVERLVHEYHERWITEHQHRSIEGR